MAVLVVVTVIVPMGALGYSYLDEKAKVADLGKQAAEDRASRAELEKQAEEERRMRAELEKRVANNSVALQKLSTQMPLGWTWEGVDIIKQTVKQQPTAHNLVELRGAAARCLASVDLRKKAELAPDIKAYCLAFSPDSKRLAVGQRRAERFLSCRVQLFDVTSQEKIEEFQWTSKNEATGVRALAFSPEPEGKWLVVGTRDGWIHAWDTTQKDRKTVSWQVHNGEVTGLAFKPDGQLLVSCSEDQTLKYWNLSGKEVVPPREFGSKVYEVTFNRSGTLLASVTENQVQHQSVEGLES